MLALGRYYWSLIRGARNWLVFATCLFLCGAAAGMITGIVKPSLAQHFLDELLGGCAGPESVFEDFSDIVKNNLVATLTSWCGGLVLGLVPLYRMFSNGFAMGGLLLREISVFQFLLALLPHGIIEFPAIVPSNAFFLRPGVRWIFQKNGAARWRTFLTDLRGSLSMGLLCAVLFLVAAIIESVATPRIVEVFYPITKSQEFQLNGPANPHQPVRSKTNRTSSAAGLGR